MSEIQAWQAIFRLSAGNSWQPIPTNLKQILGLDSRVGIMGGILCTKHTAEYVNGFINRLNSIGKDN